MQETTIRLNQNVKQKLDSFKVYSRESYNDVIARIISKPNTQIDEESLIETIEVLSDPELMSGLKQALSSEDEGVSWEDIKKELNLNV